MPPKDPFPPEADTKPEGELLRCPCCKGEGKLAGERCSYCLGKSLVTKTEYARWVRKAKKGHR